MSGLRERKKEAARLALHEAAFRLMSEHGPENVTVEAIAEAASMSRRTFSNYFSSKEEALFYREDRRTAHLLNLLRARPAEESALTALRESLLEFIQTSDLDAERMVKSRLLRHRPSLSAYRTSTHLQTEQGLSAELQRRLPEGPASRVSAQMLATSGLAALRVATSAWLENQDRPVEDLLRQALSHLSE